MWIVQLEKKILKILCVLLGVIILLAALLHLYIVNNAETLIEDFVRNKSNNKVKLDLNKIRFNYFSNKIVLEHATFYSNDSTDSEISYRIAIEKINLRVKGVLPIFTRKELIIDSLTLSAPDIRITQLKKADSSAEEKATISEQMGNIYNSITDAIATLKVKRFEINEGKFALEDNTEPTQKPLEITNLHLHIDNLSADTSENADFFSGDQMVFKTHHQSISFPDGNHNLSFSRFRINIRKRLIEIDSCTLTGKKMGKEQDSFSVYVDTVKLVKADFNALYKKKFIKADSLFCRNPVFRIDLHLENKQKEKTSIPNLDTIIQQLTGELSLGYIGVTNASIKINTYLDNIPSSFNSRNNNFEMEGLLINHSRPKPVSLNSFSMAIHNYINYLQDSSYIIRFDSILLRENRILLSNFSTNTEPHKDNRNVKVRLFGLSGLSWGDLLFKGNIIANEAILLKPDIDYTQPESVRKISRSSFLNALRRNKFVQLEKIKIIDGNINIKARNGVSASLQDADFIINSKYHTINTSITTNEGFIDSLRFTKGFLKVKDLVVDLDNAKFSGDRNNLSIGQMKTLNASKGFSFSADEFFVGAFQYQDSLNIFSGDEVSWKQGKIEINSAGENKEIKNNSLFVKIASLKGANTKFDINLQNNSTSFFLNELKATDLSFDGKADFSDLKFTATKFNYSTPGSEISADRILISQNIPSSISNLSYKKTTDLITTADISVPGVYFTPDLKSILNKHYDLKNVRFDEPRLKFILTNKTTDAPPIKLPLFNIDKLEITRPVVSLERISGDQSSVVYWNGSGNNFINADNIQTHTVSNEISVKKINSNISDFSFITSDNKFISTKKTQLSLQASSLVLRPEQKLDWKFFLNELKANDLQFDSLGKKATPLKLHDITLRNFFLSRENTVSLKDIFTSSPSYSITIQSGNYKTEKIISQWKKIAINKADRSFSVDSFSGTPVLSKDAFIKASPFQTDYITFSVSNIHLKDFVVDSYYTDSTVRINSINIYKPYFTSFRDKRPPFKHGVIKPLPSKLTQLIPFRISADTINIDDGTAVYSELNDKTNETGVITVKRISGDIFPIKNFDISATDSLRIRLNAFLLDTGWVRLRTRESYLDSLSGFLFTIRMRPHSLLYLNSILYPLAAIKLQSGYLDTITMRAIARDNYSIGEMSMHYHDLKIQFFKNDIETKKHLLQGFKTFVANSLVIKNENTKRKAVVYYPRQRDRSFINYYIKTFMSGVASSVGAKTTRKMLRKYQKELKKRNLPPIDID